MRRQAGSTRAFAERTLILLIASAVMGCAPAEESLARYTLGLKQAHRLPGHRIGCAVCRLGVCFDSRGRGLGFCVHRRGVSGRFTGPRGRVS